MLVAFFLGSATMAIGIIIGYALAKSSRPE